MPIPTSDKPLIDRVSLRQIAIDRIKAAILDHTLEPGEDLGDPELQEWLGMSRTPVREALLELTRIGLVETSPQRWTRVAVLDPETVRYDLQTLGALLGGLTRVTVPVLTPAQTASVLAAIDKVLEALHSEDREGVLPLGYEVSRQLRDYCPNPVLLKATSDMVDAKIYRISLSRITLDADWGTLTTNYQSLRDAIAAGSAIAAELAVEQIFQLDAPLGPAR
jgi:DNA-binding GntR family transcriptional regulator